MDFQKAPGVPFMAICAVAVLIFGAAIANRAENHYEHIAGQKNVAAYVQQHEHGRR
jgi:hypothetical protein